MRVYVASKWENAPRVREVFSALREDGHQITHDWTVKVADESSPDARRLSLGICAAEDVWGVETADALLLINHAGGAGMFTELGIALALHRRVVVLDGFKPGTPENVFFHLPGVNHAESLDHARQMLRLWPLPAQP